MKENSVPESAESDDFTPTGREGEVVRPDGRYRIEVGDESIAFRAYELDDPIPLGRQILATAGVNPAAGYSLFAILPSGDFEDVRLDEPFDLRARGVERFVMFLTDREFKFQIESQELQWGKPAIGGMALIRLAKLTETESLYLEVRGGEDQLVEPTDLFDLTKPGIERFIKGPKKVITFLIKVNTRDKNVPNSLVTYEQVVQLAFPGVHESNVTFSVTYRHAASLPHSGELGAGGSVEVKKKGTVFNVTRTVQS